MTDRCDVLADDGAQCTRTDHPDDADAHDFTGQRPSSDRVDGGRRWSDWIDMVNEIRGILTVHLVQEDQSLLQIHIRDWQLNYCRSQLADIARVVGLQDVYDDYQQVRVVTDKYPHVPGS